MFIFFCSSKKNEPKKGVTAQGNCCAPLTLTTTCLFSPACGQAGFQSERNSVASLLYCYVQWFDTNKLLVKIKLSPSGRWEFFNTLPHHINCLDRERPILFFVLHPDNLSMEEAVAPKRSGLGYGGVKII